MVTRVATVAFQGIDALPVDVQVQIAPGVPKFLMLWANKFVRKKGARGIDLHASNHVADSADDSGRLPDADAASRTL